MKRFYQKEWQGIQFASFAKLSTKQLANAEFYNAFYRELFKHYGGYDELDAAWRRNKGELANWIAASLSPGSRVLSVGCGLGRLSLDFLKRGSLIDAIDAVPELLEKAKFYARKANLKSHNIRWITGEMPGALFKLPSASYDLIICTEVLYMVPDPEESIKRMVEMLSPGGVLVISVRTRLYHLLYSLMLNDQVRFRIAFEEENY